MSSLNTDPNLLESVVYWTQRLEMNDLSPEELDELKAWIAKDEEHRKAMEKATALWNVFDYDDQPDRLVALRRAALADYERPKLFGDFYARQLRTRVGAVAAVAVAASVAVLGTILYEPLTTQTYETAPQERRVVSLADGSKVTMDGGTEVKVHLAHSQRKLWLVAGRANFEVAKDPLRPFTVQTDNKTVVATGTQFSVERLSSQLRVILYEGHVSVLSKKPRTNIFAASEPAAILANLDPQQELIASSTSDVSQVRQLKSVQVDDTRSWDKGLLIFDDEPIATALERVNRYGDHRVVMQNAQRRPIIINGVYKAGDTRAFVEGVSALYHLDYRLEGNDYVLTAK